MRQITQDEFDDILIEILEDKSRTTILQIPGIYEILAEEFNNDVISRWEAMNGVTNDE